MIERLKGTSTAYSMWAVSVVGAAAGLVVSIVGGNFASTIPIGESAVFLIVPAFATVGLLLARKVPDNRMGWVFLLGGGLGGIWLATVSYAKGGYVNGWAGFDYAVWINSIVYFSMIFSLVALPLLLFPDGNPPSPRWRWVLRYVIALMLITAIGNSLDPTLFLDLPDGTELVIDNPLGADVAELSEAGMAVLAVAVGLGLLAPAAAMVYRFRRSSGVERLQLKWLAYSAVVAGVAMPAFYVVQAALPGSPFVLDLLLLLGLGGVLGIPITAGIAITRYRLYDIDRLMSRTISYALLVGLLFGVYGLGVFLLGDLLPFEGGIPVAVSTLAAAALFNPLRRRLQRTIDRRFSRTDYDPQEVLDEFSSKVSEEVDPGILTSELLDVVDETIAPASSGVWIREE